MLSDYNRYVITLGFSQKENPGFDSRVDRCFSGINELNNNTTNNLFTLPIDI